MAYSSTMKYIIVASIMALYSTITWVVAEEDSDWSGKESCINQSTVTLPVTIGAFAIFSIIVGGTIAVCWPMFTSLRRDKNTFFVIMAFVTSFALATALLQIFVTNESSSCRKFPLPGFVTIFMALCTFIMDGLAAGYSLLKNQKKQTDEGKKELAGDGRDDSEGQVHGSNSMDKDSRRPHGVILLVLELSMIAHSMVIGITLGQSESPWIVIRTFVAAFTFQQFLQGMSLRACLVQEGFNSKFPYLSTISALFAGAAAGIALSPKSSSMAVLVERVFNTASGGIIVCMCLVEHFAAYLFKLEIQKRPVLHIWAWAYMATLLGMGAFSLLYKGA